MPRTIWRQANSRLISNPQFSSKSYFRACVEEHHYEILRKAYSISLYVHFSYITRSDDEETILSSVSHHDRCPSLNAAQSTRSIAIRDSFTNQNRSRTLATLTTESSRSRNRWTSVSTSTDAERDDEPRSTISETANVNNDDLRLFRWKNVIIYVNRDVEIKDQMRLLNHIYREWFSHRAENKNVSDEIFWDVLLRFTSFEILRSESESSLSQSSSSDQRKKQQQDLVDFVEIKKLWKWHATLIEELQDLEEEEKKMRWKKISFSDLRSTLQNVLVLLDEDWQREEVLLMWKKTKTTKSYDCVAESSSDVKKEDDAADENWQFDCVFRCSLKRAMQMTVSRDLYRIKTRRKWNELLKKTLRNEDADDS